jgi:hypothetical protein
MTGGDREEYVASFLGKAKAHGLCTGHLDQLDRGNELTPLLGHHGRKYDADAGPPAPSGESVHHRNLLKGDNRAHHR